MRTHSFKLDNDIMPLLFSKAESRKLSVEDYINQQLRFMLAIDYNSIMEEKNERMSCIDSLCGVLHDDGVAYEATKKKIMEERYGKI